MKQYIASPIRTTTAREATTIRAIIPPLSFLTDEDDGFIGLGIPEDDAFGDTDDVDGDTDDTDGDIDGTDGIDDDGLLSSGS